MKKKKVFLVGFMGAGKTTVGKELASLADIPFIDLDDYIVKTRGMEIATIFQTYGEKTFRLWESEALVQCSNLDEAIISTGGGIIEAEKNIEVMNAVGTMIYLKASFDTLYERIEGDSLRPLTKEGKESLKKRFLTREALYEQASIIIDTENKSPQQIAKELNDLLSE